MTSKESLSILNKYRNSHYNSVNKEEREIANALNVMLPEYVKLLEINTPKKIIKETISHYINAEDYYKVDYYKCPSCEKTVLRDRWQDITVHTTNKHCQQCGKKLDWSVLNENWN